MYITLWRMSATVIKESDNPIGSGWTLQGLNRIHTATGGVILNVGGGDSLWFTSAGSGGGYTSPAGDFSTLVKNGNNTYTRTLTDGVKQEFGTDGRQSALVDRNGLRVTYAYDGSGKLTTINAPLSGGTTRLATTTYDAEGQVTRRADYRVLYKKTKNGYVLHDFGTHDQLYRPWRSG